MAVYDLDVIELDLIQPLQDKPHDYKFLEIEFSSDLYLDLIQNLHNRYGIFIKNCPKLQSIFDILTKIRLTSKQASPFIIRLDILDFESINTQELQKFIKKFNQNIFLISIENHSNHEKVQIFWKFQNNKIFFLRVQKELSSFIVNFLASSMTIDEHFGVPADFLSSFQSTETILELDKLVLRNSSGLNLLMIAAECGDSNAVNLCLKSGFNVNEKENGRSAVELAWKNQHFEIVLELLKANSQFPRTFEVSLATKEIRRFVDLTMDLQGSILDANFHKIEEIMRQHPNLRHFYSIQNISAPAFALLNGKFEAYEFLITNNVYIGPDEKMDELLRQVSSSGAENIEEIHKKYLKSFKENHLMILTVNSFVGHDVPNAEEKLSHVRKAFMYLDQVHPFVSLILQTVAASKEFQIIFDFNRQTIQHLDPTADQGFRGMFYLSRQIYIAAGDLLNPNTILDVYGTLIHELCHYAMLLVYNNFCKPYFESEGKAVNLYTKIAAICERNKDKEELVMLAFRYYLDMQHAELVVRVPQLMVLYSKDQAKIQQCRQNYPGLFRFCEQFVTFDMQNHLPNIKSTTEEKVHEFKKWNKRQTKVLVSLTITLPFAVWLAILIAMPYIEPLYSCGNLTDELRLKIFESTVDFQGVNVIFGDLFGRNSTACENLSPQEVTEMLKVFDSGKNVENYTEIYEDLGVDGDERSLERIQAKNMMRTPLNDTNPDLAEKIYEKYKETKFKQPGLKVHQKVNTRSKFYIKRNLTYPHQQNSILTSKPLKFSHIPSTNLLLLSDKGGSGKSTYFRHMAWKLKRRFPLKWISYVDLKQHIHVLQDVPKIDANLTTVVGFLSSKLLNLTLKLEIGVFEKKFLSNESIFLWDAVDEVSPVYTDEILRLIKAIRKLTGNGQWVSSLPHLEEIISTNLDVRSHKLEDYNEDDKKEFIIKFMQFEDQGSPNSTKIVEEITNFSKRLSNKASSQNPASNPQILQMICESYMNSVLTGDLRNIYTLYDNHSRELFRDVYNKGEISRKDAVNVSLSGGYRKFHQHFAVTSEIFLLSITKSAYSSESFKFDDLEMLNWKVQYYQEYLRYKIVYNMNNRTLFEHDSYKDFFIAQYIKDHIWYSKITSPRDKEIFLRLEFLFYIFDKYDSVCSIVGDFILGFIEADVSDSTEPLNEHIQKIIKENYTDLLFKFGKNIKTVELITRFFKKDRDMLNTIWKIHQNQTFFHFYTERHPSDVNEITKLVNDNFELKDRRKIYSGASKNISGT